MTVKQKSGVLFSIAIVGLLGTGVAAIWADRKVRAKVKEETEDKSFVKTYWPYAVPVATASLTIGAMAANQYISTAEMSRLAGVAGASIATLSQYKSAVREVAGDEVADKIEERVEKAPPAEAPIYNSDRVTDVLDEYEEITCYDDLTGITFTATPTQVLEAEYDINRRIAHGEYIEVADWLSYFEDGDIIVPPEFNGLGWEIGNLVENHGLCWVDFAHRVELIDDMNILGIHIVTPIDTLMR